MTLLPNKYTKGLGTRQDIKNYGVRTKIVLYYYFATHLQTLMFNPIDDLPTFAAGKFILIFLANNTDGENIVNRKKS